MRRFTVALQLRGLHHRIRVSCLCVTVVLLSAACSRVSTPSADRDQPPARSPVSHIAPTPFAATGEAGLKKIDEAALKMAIDTTAHDQLIPGALVLLRTPQGEFTVAYGTTKLGAELAPTADTYFRIASNTKTMTAAVILQLAQEKKLSLDDPVSKYVAGVPNGPNIIVAELLDMRSGLFNYTSDPKVSQAIDRDPTKVWTPQELLALAFAHPPNFAPGSAYEYCNTNYALLGMIAEKVGDKRLPQAMHDRLFAPLGLQHTELPAPSVNIIPKPYSHGYLYGSSSVALVGEPTYTSEQQTAARAGTLRPKDYTDVNHSFATAAGGAISTANDLATWIEALVSGRVLNSEYQQRWLNSLRPEDPSKPNGQQYGYGISRMSWGPNVMYFHGGETAGYNSFIGYDATNKVTLVVWTNLTVSLDDIPTANTLMLKVLDQIYALSPLTPAPSPTANH